MIPRGGVLDVRDSSAEVACGWWVKVEAAPPYRTKVGSGLQLQFYLSHLPAPTVVWRSCLVCFSSHSYWKAEKQTYVTKLPSISLLCTLVFLYVGLENGTAFIYPQRMQLFTANLTSMLHLNWCTALKLQVGLVLLNLDVNRPVSVAGVS